MRSCWLAVPFALLAACSVPDGVTPRRSPPNIVFVLADDMGYGDVRALNAASRIPTPHLDGLAAAGCTFVDAHTPSSVCTPTRYGVLTGRYCWRSRLKKGVLNGYGEPLIDPQRRTVADLLRDAGYHTSVVGKWHLGLDWPKGPDGAIRFDQPVGGPPNDYGFDHSLIIPASLDFPPYVYLRDGRVTDPRVVEQPAQRFPAFLRKGPRAEDLVMEEVLGELVGHACDVVAERAAAGQPFFLYLPLPAPHKPVLPHPQFRGLTELGDYGDFVAQVDDAVGRLLRALDEAGVADDTLLVYTSDNGSFMHRFDEPDRKDHVDDARVQGYRAANHRANGPLRGTKADIWEAGHRVPFFVRWPGVVPAGARSDATICLTDLFATCAEVVGRPLGDAWAEDSFSFLPHALGRAPAVLRAPVVHHSVAGMFAIRRGDWKLVAGNGSGGRQKPRGQPFAGPFQLFDLATDLGETTDVAARFPAVVAELTAELQALRERGRSRP
ncbi:MAG: arylsulfatase [Planctomycetes bacterium]|nr:arylsulfatase [Planctomycetota bacterium]